jgi:uroporphyrinogen decarboxylase
MDSRERVFLAIDHQEPDRVPHDFWASSGAWSVIAANTGMDRDSFLDAHDIDFRYIEGPRYIGPPLAADTDIWGVKRRVVTIPTAYGAERYSEVDISPLAGANSPEEIEEYTGWPSPDDFDYSVVKQQARAVRDAGRVAVFMGDRLNRIAQLKPAMYLRGPSLIFMDLILNPELARAIFARLRSFYEQYLERILDAADGLIDIVLTGDDFGQQRNLFASPATWEEFLAEGFGRYLAIIAAHGVRSMHHTCGNVRLIVPRMQQLGLDVLQSLQPEAMGDYFAEMKADYGDRMSFQGGISIQQTMPKGNTDDVKAEVRARVQTLAPGGGYILCTSHNIQADCSIENIRALTDAYRTFTTYPLAGRRSAL